MSRITANTSNFSPTLDYHLIQVLVHLAKNRVLRLSKLILDLSFHCYFACLLREKHFVFFDAEQ